MSKYFVLDGKEYWILDHTEYPDYHRLLEAERLRNVTVAQDSEPLEVLSVQPRYRPAKSSLVLELAQERLAFGLRKIPITKFNPGDRIQIRIIKKV